MIIISGPSTIGKNPFIYEVCKNFNFSYVTPLTTRQKRAEEIDKVDYTFLTKEEFKEKIRKNVIKQWDYCLKNYYGYSFDFPGDEDTITHGLSRMALRIKALYPDSITTIFLYPKSIENIMITLEKLYTGDMLLLRKTLVEEELCHSSLFDYCFTVDGLSIDLLQNDSVMGLLSKNQKWKTIFKIK